MEFKNIIGLSVTKNDREYMLHIPIGAPHGEVYDVLFQMLQKVAAEALAAAERAAPKEVSPIDGDQDGN
jgi:hypothetical protein